MCSAQVLAITPQGIVLDRTVFYPLGGGQAGDTGMLLLEDGSEIAIADTRKGAQPGEIEQRRTNLAVHHALRIAEEVLVVGALGRGVGEHQGGLPAATGAAAALGVVRRGGRQVAHVDHHQLGDVDAELHGG